MDAIGVLAAAESGALSRLTFKYVGSNQNMATPSREFIIVFPGKVCFSSGSDGPYTATTTILAAGMYLNWIYGTIQFTGTGVITTNVSTSFAYLT